MRIFLTHGRDLEAVRRVQAWFRRNHPEIELIVFTPALGDPIPMALEVRAAQADAAIVLATPDDLGGLRGSLGDRHSRARQNVWMELGFFWARLGRHRTLLLLRSGEDEAIPEIPTNVSGLGYALFGASLAVASRQLNDFVTNARTLPADQLTEVVSVSSALWTAINSGETYGRPPTASSGS